MKMNVDISHTRRTDRYPSQIQWCVSRPWVRVVRVAHRNGCKNSESIVARKSFAMKTDILMNGSMVKNHISLRKGLGFHATRRTSFLLWFQACQVRPLDLHQLQGRLQNRRIIAHDLLQPRLLHLKQVKFRLENEIELRVTSLQWLCQLRLMMDQGDLMITKPIKLQKPKKKKPQKERVSPLLKDRYNPLCSDVPEWLQQFRENLVDDRVSSWMQRLTRQFFPWSIFRAYAYKMCGFGEAQYLYSFPSRPKLRQGPRAEDALAEPYLVLKILVTW